MQIKVLKGLQNCILTYGYNKASIVGNQCTVVSVLEMLEPASKLNFSWVLSQRRGFMLTLSYIRYASWDHVPGMIDVDLALKELSTQSANLYLTVIGSISFVYRLDIVNDIGPISFCPSALSRTDILSDTHRSDIG